MDHTTWPADALEPVRSCPICRASGRQLLYAGLTDHLYCTPGEWTLYRCVACGTAYLDPRPSQASSSLAYSSYYTHVVPGQKATPLGGVVSRLRRALRNGYLHGRYPAYAERPRWSPGRLAVPLFPTVRTRLDHMTRALPRPRPGARVLDAGCGNGGWLLVAGALGYKAVGCDMDAAAVAAASKAGLMVLQGRLLPLAIREAAFDAVVLCHVIEHLHDPIASLRELWRILRPGGLLWVATPNLGSPAHRRFRRHWLDLDPPRHLQVFTVESLELALRIAGFCEARLLRPAYDHHASVAASYAIEQGMEVRLGEPPALPKELRRFISAADRQAQRRFDRAAELVMAARKPG